MNENLPTVAIFSESQQAYSETFIQAHRNIPNVNIRYYWGGHLPEYSDIDGNLLHGGIYRTTTYNIFRRLSNPPMSYHMYSLAKSLLRNRVDVALAEYGVTGIAILPVCKYCNIPLIVYFRGYDAFSARVLGKYLAGYKEMFKYASKIMCVSHSIISQLKELGCPPEKLMFHSSAPDMEYYQVRPNYTNKLFIGIGRFVDKKAPYYTIFAFSQVQKKYPEAKLIIGGDGPLLNTCKNLIRYLGLSDSVFLPGVLPPEEFMRLLQDATAFVQHSIVADTGDSEGTPLSILEACAAAVPVISTRHSGIPYAVIDEVTGLLVDEHDVNGMSKMMCRIIEEPGLAEKLGAAARKRMMDQFNLDERLRSLSDIIYDLAPKTDKNQN
jgi:colanic acid/amylovoran biosynthesis glycosyltransferase